MFPQYAQTIPQFPFSTIPFTANPQLSQQVYLSSMLGDPTSRLLSLLGTGSLGMQGLPWAIQSNPLLAQVLLGQGVPLGIPQGLPFGIPQGLPFGIPQTQPFGTQPFGIPQGLPFAGQQALPLGLQQALPLALQAALSPVTQNLVSAVVADITSRLVSAPLLASVYSSIAPTAGLGLPVSPLGVSVPPTSLYGIPNAVSNGVHRWPNAVPSPQAVYSMA